MNPSIDPMDIVLQRIAEEAKKRTGELDLSQLAITELPAALFKLTHLRALNLSVFYFSFTCPRHQHKAISDLSGIGSLRALRTLTFFGTNVLDLTPLSDLANLQVLNCSHTQVSSLTPLSVLANLQALNCAQTRVSDLRPLHTLADLRSLDCFLTQISDLKPLSALANLQSLDCSHTQVSDLTPLYALANLQMLDCSNNQISDLTPVKALTSLHSLSCRQTQVTDLTPLSKLGNLQSINCSHTEVSDISSLSNLTNLQSLNCSNTLVTDISSLSDLSNLQQLDCWSTQITDLTPLSGLAFLQSLDCSHTKVSDLAPISDLKNLESLDCTHTLVSDLIPLSNLSYLQKLKCGYTQFSDLMPLSGLSRLQSLDCSGAPVKDLTPLSDLANLQSLDCSDTEVSDLSAILPLTRLRKLSADHCLLTLQENELWRKPSLQETFLLGSQVRGIPAELLTKSEYDNCLPRIRAHLDDLEAGCAEVTDVKLLVLGNGRAGKTQLVNRLRGPEFAYQPTWDSTHGVQVASACLLCESATIRLHVWDFGGQDIYHGTHALFTRTRAVTAVVWARDTECVQSYELHGIFFRNHPLRYWLNYARHQSRAGNPLLIVQGKCDIPACDVRRPVYDDADVAGVCSVKELQFSAMNNRGRPALDDALREAATMVHGAERVQIGAGRLRVQRRLETLRDADAALASTDRLHRTLDQAYFRILCAEEGGVSDAALLLDYLHNCGVLFYREGLFNDAIILDQGWALDAIYAVFQRQKSYRHLRFTRGRFTRPLLADLVWASYGIPEQRLFLSMMKQCGICFAYKNGKASSNAADDDDATEYMAPDLLPDLQDVQAELNEKWSTSTPCQHQNFSYEFSHPGLMRNLIARIGQEARINALYWQGGVCLYEANTASRALLTYQTASDWQGMLSLQTQGGRAEVLLQQLSAWISEEQSQLGLDFKTSTQLTVSKAKSLKLEPSDDTNGVSAVKPIFVQPPRAKPEMFVSYAWGDAATPAGIARADIVDALCDRAQQRGLTIERDKHALGLGDSINQFMARIGTGDRVFVILSEKYLCSPYCMFELFEVWRHSCQDGAGFLRRVRIFALPDAAISSALDRVKIAVFWKKQHSELQAAIQDHGADVVGEADFRAFKLMGDYARHVSDVLAVMASIVRPTTIDELESYGFEDLT